MASLTAHLRRTDDHGRLPFHPECPLCRSERLAGAPPIDPLISRRSQALLAASVLAMSSATPTAVLAAEPDQEQEGATAPEQLTTAEARSAPDFDTGGQPTDLQLDVGAAAPEADAEPEADAVVPQDATDVDEAAAATGAPSTDEADEPPVADVLAPPSPVPQPVPTPASPAQHAPEATLEAPQVESVAPPRERKPEPGSRRERPDRAAVPHAVPTGTDVVTPSPRLEVRAVPAVTIQSTTIRLARATATHRRAVQPADRFHVVRPGESLWSIAKDRLGGDASVARIAREVNRLWELNSARIGTGEPDLLIAGTRIALR